jgi:signal transduction histidine kinase
LLPELLHALSQPLTSLRCSLEVTLLQPRDSEEYRKRLRESLKLTEDITVLARGIRELMDVEQPLAPPRDVALDKILRSAVREFLPLADAEGVGLSLFCGPSLVTSGDTQLLFTAVMHFLSFLMNLAKKGEEVSVQANADSGEIALTFETIRRGRDGRSESTPSKEAAETATAYLKLLVARRIFEVAGGGVLVDRGEQKTTIRARLPVRVAESKSREGGAEGSTLSPLETAS